MNKKKVSAIVVLVAVCAIGIARVLGYDVTPVCAVVPTLCE